MKRPTKAQAALEFLSTYGFAFLIILVMIGALAYFGVLNPQRFLPNRCTFDTGFGCQDFRMQIDTASGDQLVVDYFMVNNLGKTITINAAPTFDTFSLGDDGTAACSAPGAFPAVMPAGSVLQFTCTIDSFATSLYPPDGEKMRVRGEFTYIEAGGRFNKRGQGEIFSEVEYI